MKDSIFYLVLLGAIQFSCSSDDGFEDPVSEQYTRDLQIIDEFLTSNGVNAQIDNFTGIRYVVETNGTGLSPYVFDSLTLTYSNTVLSSGVTFEEVTNEKRPINDIFPTAAYMARFIQEGGSLTAWLPSFYGLGTAETDQVPANSVLVLELDLEELHNQQLFQDIILIDDSLQRVEEEPLIHRSGIRYFLNQGDGSLATDASIITIDYEGRFFNGPNAGEVFDSQVGASFNLSGLIGGWQIMIPEMRIGGEMTMILPSSFAYGQAGNPGSNPPIGSNEILVFDVTLNSFN